jgi:dTDP-4-dehydrorhamnose reductase
MRILVLGGTGMLGHMVASYLAKHTKHQIHATFRREIDVSEFPNLGKISWWTLDITKDNLGSWKFANFDYIINCIGVIKPKISDTSPCDIRTAININAVFPYELAEWSYTNDTKVIQIATDCVFSGDRCESNGLGYLESSPHTPQDIYGKTKSLGEVKGYPNFHNLRCSIIGPEWGTKNSLFEWIRHSAGSKVTGYKNHLWNGLTTLHFAKICAGIINHNLELPELAHVLPINYISKADLIQEVAKRFKLQISVRKKLVDPCNRRLASEDFTWVKLWKAAGYPEIPTVEQMIMELREYTR